MTSRANVLLWTDSTAAYLDAIKAAGLADRVAVDTPAAQGQAVRRAARPDRGADGRRRAAGPAAGDAEAALGAGDDGGRRGLARAARPAAERSRSPARAARTRSRCRRTSSARCSMSPSPTPRRSRTRSSGKWVRTVAQPLTGKTLGILGLGAIGQEVARIAAALGMRVIGTRRRPEPMPNVAEVLPAGAHRRGAGANPTSCCCCCRRRRRPTTSSTPGAWR